jgi:hypothetical protein
MMFALASALVAAATCPAIDHKAAIVALHETTRKAHLSGDAAPIAATIGDTLLLAENGVIRTQSNAEVAKFFTGYLSRVRYREWSDVGPPVVTVSPDGQLAWMAVAIAARYTRADKPADPEKSFKSSWIATFARHNCAWRMTAIASDIVE